MEQWNIDGGTVEQSWWNSETVIVGQWNSDGGTGNSNCGTVGWNSGTVMVEQWNSNGGTVEQ